MKNAISLNLLIATVLCLGKAPVAPGTVATLFAGIPCFLAIGHFSWQIQLLFSILIFGAGWYFSEMVERELRQSDPGEVVIDELCGYLVAMIGHPVAPASIFAGFLFFRLFDIWKPWPLRYLDNNLKGGMGIMMDDVGAGIYANLAGLIVLRVLDLS